VLEGSFAAVISPTLSVELHRGEMIGEMAIFESMSRSADIVTREDSVLAVLTFQELDSLAAEGDMPSVVLQMKLLKMFAVASIRKLRSTSEKTGKVPTVGADSKDPSTGLAASKPKSPLASPKSSPRLSPTSSSTAVSVVAPQPAPGTTRESLYRVRLALEKDKDAAHRLAEEERAARLKVEKRNQSVGASLERYKNLAARFKDALTKAGERAEQQSREMDDLRVQMAGLQDEFDTSHASHHAVQQRLNQEIHNRSSAARAAIEAREMAAAQYEKASAAQSAELTTVLARGVDLELQLAHMAEEVTAAKALASECTTAAETTSSEYKARIQAMQTEFDELAASKKLSDEQWKHQMGLASQLGIQLANLKTSLKEEQEKVASAVVWKHKATELTAQLQAEKKESLATMATFRATTNSLNLDIFRYSQVLRYVTIACFVKLYKLKKSTKHLHIQISDLLVNILEGHVLATSAAGIQGASQSEGSSPDSTLQLIKKSLQRKKRNYLDAVLKKTSGGGSVNSATTTGWSALFASSGSRRPADIKIHDLLLSLEEEVYKLKRPFDEVAERIQHWKRTSESFFSRNIELTSLILAFKKKLSQLTVQNTTLKSVLTKHNSEYESVLAANAALKLEIARFKNEIAAYKASARLLEVAADVVGARKAEMENVESRIVLQKAQLAYVQQRYVETVDALNAAVTSHSNHASHRTLDLSPPKGGPHFPPPAPSAYNASPSMTQLLESTLGFTRSASFDSFNGTGTIHVPAPHEDPEFHHTASLRGLHQTQQDLALAEFEKWKRLQFVLENQPEESKKRVRKPKNPDPLVSSLASLSEVASLRIEDSYASVFDVDDDVSFDELAPRHRSRAEEEESKSAMLASPTLRVKEIKNNMGRSLLGDLGSVRSNNNYHSNNHSRNSTDIGQNAAFTSVGGVAHTTVGGGGVAAVLGVAPHTSYSSFAPQPSTSEQLAPGFSRTLMLLKKPTTAPAGAARGMTSTLPRLDGVQHDYANVYGIDNGAGLSRTMHGSPSSTRSSRSQGIMLASPSSYHHPASASIPSSSTPERNSFRGHLQYQSSTSLNMPGQSGLASPKTKRQQQAHHQQPDALTSLSSLRPQPPVSPVGPFMMNNYATQM
jgi:CRP-like cAMP-binding protein